MTASEGLTDHELDRWLSVAMAEYESLRQESLQAQRQQQEVVRTGYAAITLLAGVAAALSGRGVAPTILLLIAPLLAIGTAIVWLGELGRMVRVGAYLVEREAAVNDALSTSRGPRGTPEPRSERSSPELTSWSTSALGWESALREGRYPRQRLVNLYKATFINLATLGTGAAAAGIILLFLRHAPTWLIVLTITAETVAAALVALLFRAQLAIRDQARGLYPGLREQRNDGP